MTAEPTDAQRIAASLGPIAATVLAPLWFRAAESARRHHSRRRPILVDEWAERTSAELGIGERDYGRNIAGSIRAAWLDDRVRAHRARVPAAPVIQLGAGLDAAVHRVDLPGPWCDIDLPSVLALREKTGLADADRGRAGYEAVAADLSTEAGWQAMEARLRAATSPPIVLAGGLLYYLAPTDVQRLIAGIADVSPGETRIALDVLPPWFVRRTQRPRSTTLGSAGRYRWPRMTWACRIKDLPRLSTWHDRLRVERIDDYTSTGHAVRWGWIAAATRLLPGVRARLQGGLAVLSVA